MTEKSFGSILLIFLSCERMTIPPGIPLGYKIRVRYRSQETDQYLGWKRDYDSWRTASLEFYNLKNSLSRHDIIRVEFELVVYLNEMD